MTERDSATGRVLLDFEGAWQLERRIQSTRGPDARFDGVAEWSVSQMGLAYVEKGQMTMEGHAPLHAERRYFWAQDLSVYFEDGRFFHQVPASGGETAHWCDPDHYALRYDFQNWPDFDVFWRVQGPRKDYEAHTHYSRQ